MRVVDRRSAVAPLATVLGARPLTRASRTMDCVAPRAGARCGRESLERCIASIAGSGVSSGPNAASAARSRSASFETCSRWRSMLIRSSSTLTTT
ncbi:MAG: hypothetical protein ABSG43_26690, partial [Solirubrobacteraceae bacterium]